MAKLTRIFPGKYPYVKNDDGSFSNVKTSVIGIDDMFYVIPTMRDGNQYSVKEATDIAIKEGINKYPKYKTQEDAVNFSKNIHDKIDRLGFRKRDARKTR